MTFCELVLVGNVGREPELRYTNNGTAVCDFSLAVNRRRKINDRWEDETTWFRITVWGSQAESVNQYLEKGRQVLVVSDRVEARAYTGRDGEARASLDVTARQVRFLGNRDGGAPSGGGNRSGGGSNRGGGQRQQSNYDDPGDDYYDDAPPSNSEDIPF